MLTLPGLAPIRRARAASVFYSGLTGVATVFIVGLLVVILAHIAWSGRSAWNWRFLTSGTEGDLFDPATAGVLPMLIGTTGRVLLMTVLVMPVGVLTAVYLAEFTRPRSRLAWWIRTAVNNLAGVPSIVFGLFGLGFFIGFVGGSLDEILGGVADKPHWGRPAILWASATLAIMTLPVVIMSTEEALRGVPPGLREASYALGASRAETIGRVVIPAALPGILTGGILAVSRAAGEVAPILFTGAVYYMARLPHSLTDPFMDLGYHAFVLSTQTPNPDATRPVLYATVLTLLMLTLGLNLVAVLIRARIHRSSATGGL
jgi:phosphate transport system permease protein